MNFRDFRAPKVFQKSLKYYLKSLGLLKFSKTLGALKFNMIFMVISLAINL